MEKTRITLPSRSADINKNITGSMAKRPAEAACHGKPLKMQKTINKNNQLAQLTADTVLEETSRSPTPEFGSSLSSDDLEQLDLSLKGTISTAATSMEAKTVSSYPVSEPKTIPQATAEKTSEDLLKDSLRSVFPDNKSIPARFFATPLHVQFEMLRIFLYTEVSLCKLKLPLRKQDWTNYDILWNVLRRIPELEGKMFPERVSKEAWAACHSGLGSDYRGVNMSGSLKYRSSADGPLFRFTLSPLKLEKTHRLSRRFGCDRFLEIDIPSLSGRGVPKLLQTLGPKGKTIVIEWLGETHCLLSRVWTRFYTKPRDQQNKSHQSVEVPLSDRIYFFAVDGNDFRTTYGTPEHTESLESRSAWSIKGLLNWIRPIYENQHQPALKLYDRTRLALSRNIPTVVIPQAQICRKKDLFWPRDSKNGQCMTDGGGRLSPSLAMKIAQKLGLSYLPSGFQARLGNCKGFWVVDIQDSGNEDWIEVYSEQEKWVRKGTLDDPDYKDPAHRIFEVNKFPGPLKSADLNQQLLPILMYGAPNVNKMRDDISELLKATLTKQIEEQRMAMNDQLSFRNWLRDSNSGLVDRAKHGIVPYKASLPLMNNERLNMLVDAGFDPLKLNYPQELSRQVYERNCTDIEAKMNIRVDRSTYAFMAPDWTETLEEGEIYLNPSESANFGDELSFFTGLPLEGEMLVARIPAHFASDIQKVTAVRRNVDKLMGLRDVVVFSTRGACLADKLSGGDYDGDQAWICWEPVIVENFENSKVPKQPDLVKEGYIVKDSITYKELVQGKPDAEAAFLNHGLEFNLERRMVGSCTNYKESWCYTYRTIKSTEAVWIIKLLSDLVDQAKHGYKFSEEQWDAFKKGVLKEKTNVKEPRYKSKTEPPHPKQLHIIDRLKYVAQTPCWDEDLVAFNNWAMKEAAINTEWRAIMNQLGKDVGIAKDRWVLYFGARSNKLDETRSDFGRLLTDLYERFLAIQPVDNSVARTLLQSWHSNSDSTLWAQLRASALFASYSKHYVSKFVWWMAATQLCQMKAIACGGSVAMTHPMNAMLKPDSTYVKLRMAAKKYKGMWGEEGVIKEEEDVAGDEDD